jgi:hypothetical protein
MELGSTRTCVISNLFLVGTGCYTAGISIVGYKTTTNHVAKAFYTLSVLCSSSAVCTGIVAVMARACQISQTAALSESFGAAFMILGNQAHVRALQLESKLIPQHLNAYVRKSFRKPLYNNNGLGFVMPSQTNYIISSKVIQRIPFETIGKFAGIGLSVYGYSRLIIVVYRYSEQLFNKFKSRKQSLFLIKRIRFVAIRLYSKIDSFMDYEVFD